ncbi:hypothetical protein P3X46_015425 [Hevea brasiliensis]|uniref:Glyoxal oxidase N-terminal domain-containing protein n=1 Tax=Hevea brasiliensis TaxID=3981 RepID=A0ABQ9M000_HEVBR|nr:hypothetical protein P3X46_015425 [Hevea brasiliensis]
MLCSQLAYPTSFFSTTTGWRWVLLQESIGISAMHIQTLKNSKVIIFDRTDFGFSNLSLPHDCTAHSVLYDIASNKIRPPNILANTWCSSGAVDTNGTLIQTGGDEKGERVIRAFIPCDDKSGDWVELSTPLLSRRWYASCQILPDGRIIIVGGRTIYPKNSQIRDNIFLRFLVETKDPQEGKNFYPFLHLLADGNLFIFANNRSILNFPCTGSSILLPLLLNKGTDMPELPEAEVMICGGSKPSSYVKAYIEHGYNGASSTCGRLRETDPKLKCRMELMPTPRVMNDMILLPTGAVIIINGAANGTVGWNDAVNLVLYLPEKIPRMYHPTAALLPDGRILACLSNPHPTYNLTAYTYETDRVWRRFTRHMRTHWTHI